MPLRYTIEVGGRYAVVGTAELVIGRSLSCALAVDHGSVSRVHASVRIVGDACEIADLGSSNGTFVNGRRVRGTPVPIGPNDDVRLGRAQLKVMITEADGFGDTWNRLDEPDAAEDQPTDMFSRDALDDEY